MFLVRYVVGTMAAPWYRSLLAIRAVAVLSLGMESLPDVVVWHRQAEILERYLSSPGSGTGGRTTRVAEFGDASKCWNNLPINPPPPWDLSYCNEWYKGHFRHTGRVLPCPSNTRVREEDMRFGNNNGKDAVTASVKKGNRGCGYWQSE